MRRGTRGTAPWRTVSAPPDAALRGIQSGFSLRVDQNGISLSQRPRYVKSVLENIINWDFVARNLDGQGISRADQEQRESAETGAAITA